MKVPKIFLIILIFFGYANLFCNKGFIIIHEDSKIKNGEIEIELVQFSEEKETIKQLIPLRLVLHDSERFKDSTSIIVLDGKRYILIDNAIKAKKTVKDLMEYTK